MSPDETTRPWTRWRAAAIHLAASVTLLTCAAVLAMVLWYPPSLFHVSGVDRLLAVMASIDVCAGPLLTLLVYRHGKRGLHFDLTVIVLLQAGFFLYGAHVFFDERPVVLAGAIDRFELVFANEIPPGEWAKARAPFARPRYGRPQLVGVALPRDPTQRSDLMFAEIAGHPASAQPRLYVPFERVAPGLLQHAYPLAMLDSLPDAASAWRKAVARLDTSPAHLRWLPLESSRGNAVELVDARTGLPRAALPLDPWPLLASQSAQH